MTMFEGRNKPLISIIVPTYNRCMDLKRCLDSLMRQTVKDFEIIVIDNGSTDQTSSLLNKYPVKVIMDSTKNLAYLFNLGWRNASAEIVAYINDDAEAVPDWLENICKTFENFRHVAMVGGPTIVVKDTRILGLYKSACRTRLAKFVAELYNKVITEGRLFEIGVLCESGAYSIGAALPRSAKLEHPIYVDMLSITGMAVRKSVFHKIGGFDENFIFCHIDGDFFVRVKRAGYKLLFNPKVIVWHYINPKGGTRDSYNLGRDFAYFYMKNIRPKTASGWLRFALNIAFLNCYWVYEALKYENPRSLKGVHGFISGISDHFKLKRKK